jgi:hypothetical protein
MNGRFKPILIDLEAREGDKGQDMKKEDILEFLSNDDPFKYEFDGFYWDMLDAALDRFFLQYQPERLNEEAPKGDAKV